MRGALFFKFNDYRLNARNPFERERLPNQKHKFFGKFSMPIKEEIASLDAKAFLRGQAETKTVIAKAPDRRVENSLNASFSSLNSTVALR